MSLQGKIDRIKIIETSLRSLVREGVTCFTSGNRLADISTVLETGAE